LRTTSSIEKTWSISSSRRPTGLPTETVNELLVESTWKTLALSEAQGEALRGAGRSLAKGTGRYGEPLEDPKASLIRVESLGGGEARIKVVDAVGMVAVEGLQLTVVPKIPQSHFLEIVSRSGRLPAISALSGTMQRGDGFAELVCQWFMSALERIVAEGLLQDYREVRDEIKAVRGRLEPLATARFFYRGRLAVSAHFDEFGYDHPLNRILLAAARTVSGAPFLSGTLRRRATRVAGQLPEVGLMTPADLAAEVDRSSTHYGDGILLAKEVIAATGRSLSADDTKTWTFLFRTALPIEEGLRAILSEAFRPVPVLKSSFPIGGVSMRANPDLSFGDPAAIGDVKYKIGDGTWNRSDLYQLVAFAAAAGVNTALLVDFRPHTQPPLPSLKFGDIDVLNASWRLLPEKNPDAAREQLVQEVGACIGLTTSGS
jgi:hypothetical protein